MKKYVIPILLAILLALLHMFIADQALDTIPSSMLVRSNVPFNAEGIAPFSKSITNTKYGKLSVVQTNGEYGELAGIEMKYGEFMTEKSQAVISDSLAAKIFLTDLVIGAKITIGQSEYTVCGVYFEDRSLFSKLSSDFYDEVYITSDSDGYAPTFYIGMDEGESAADKVTQIETEYGIMVTDYENYSEVRDLIKQGQRSVIFIFALAMFAASVIWFAKNICKDIRKMITYSAFVIISVIILSITSFDLILPQEYISSGMKFFEYCLEQIRTANTYSGEFLTKYSDNVLFALFIIRVYMFLIMLCQDSKLKKH